MDTASVFGTEDSGFESQAGLPFAFLHSNSTVLSQCSCALLFCLAFQKFLQSYLIISVTRLFFALAFHSYLLVQTCGVSAKDAPRSRNFWCFCLIAFKFRPFGACGKRVAAGGNNQKTTPDQAASYAKCCRKSLLTQQCFIWRFPNTRGGSVGRFSTTRRDLDYSGGGLLLSEIAFFRPASPLRWRFTPQF